MGGHDGGDVASRIVVEEFGKLADDGYDPARAGDLVTETLEECQRRISEYGAEQIAERGARGYAGTTVAAALLVDDGGPKWLLVNLGDSRIYRLKGDHLDQVSVDHSVVQELVDAGTITSRGRRHPPRAPRDHPCARRPRLRRRRLLPAAARRRSSDCSSAPTGSAG